MIEKILKIRNHYATIYKFSLFAVSIILLVALFPRESTFKYDFRKGKYWMHNDLVAPFDFAILKSEEELIEEKNNISNELKFYFKIDKEFNAEKRKEFSETLDKYTNANLANQKEIITKKEAKFALQIFDTLIQKGIIESVPQIENNQSDINIVIINNNEAEEKEINDIYTVSTADKYIRDKFENQNFMQKNFLIKLIENAIFQSVKFDEILTQKEQQDLLSNISTSKGMVENGQRIISKGELITNEKFQILQSLKKEFESQLVTESKYYKIILGQVILISISIIVLILFLNAFRKDILADNKKIVFLLLVIFVMVFVTSLIIKTDANYIYLIPLCIVPVIIRVFFDTRLALFVHLVTIIMIGFLAPNSFEFVFIQMIAGIITIISVVNLEKRAQFFQTSYLIFITYSLIYIGLSLIQEGKIEQDSVKVFAMFAASSMLTLFSYPLIFVFEKLFGYVTDVSLMELSNTNSKLLREMATKTPGTFQHSMQVANLVEEVIFEIGGNALLARAGAMYHDIGKIENPMYFVENQTTGINPHDELSYDESAEIILSHVTKGIKIARKYRIPEQLIDFIRTHHGTRKTEYFFQKYKSDFPDELINEESYTYRGPVPFSKETAVLMMVDSVEAAARSIKMPDDQKISLIVDSIIDGQIKSNQFINSNITFRDIEKIKKILKKNLVNIYHARIEYPSL